MQYEDLRDWLQLLISGYAYKMAPWIETGQDREIAYCVIGPAGGPRPDVEDRRKNYNVFLLGPANQPGQGSALLADADKIMLAAVEGDLLPCGAANIAAIGEPTGPGLTSEKRAWVQITLQITF